MDSLVKCRFFKESNPNSCIRGNKCPYFHVQSSQPPKKQQPPKEPQKPKVLTLQDIQDPETKTRLIYLQNMMVATQSRCMQCQKNKYLAMTNCGCQVVCRDCFLVRITCPACDKKINHQVIIEP